jgi:hypothetical protein
LQFVNRFESIGLRGCLTGSETGSSHNFQSLFR